MWGELPQIRELLQKKQYNQATKQIKKSINATIEEGQQNELITILRKEMLLLNMSGDANRTALFCEKVMIHCLESGLNIANYVEQCRVLNKELDWCGEQYKLIIQELYSLDSETALHVILAIFENLNQHLLSAKPNDLERIFYFSYVHGMETSYESGISALSRLLQLWFNGTQARHFRGRFIGLPYVAEAFQDLREKLEPIIRSLNYLEWLCSEISIHNVSMENQDSKVVFVIHDKDEYYRYKLPFIRETGRMQMALRSLPIVKKAFSWEHKEIRYSDIIEIKESGDDFRLKIDPETFIESYKRATERAYQSHLLIMQDLYISNMHELKIKDKSVTVMDLFFFYYALKTLALTYFEATQYFIQTNGKEARAPYLTTDRKTIGQQFIPLLSKVFQREITQSDIDEMINLFSFGSDSIFDLYYKPLVVKGNTVTLIPSIFMMNNFSKTFLRHMNELNVHLAERGSGFEEGMQDLFTRHGFIVHPEPLPYSYQYEGRRINGDIDLIARKGKYLFIGQLKNRLEPLEPRDYRGADKKINQGAKQAEQAELYIKRNPDEFCNLVGISREELEDIEICPFVLVSCFYGSGQQIRNIPVIDSSALIRFLDEGEIRVYPGEKEPYSRAIRTKGDVIPEEFCEFLSKPYFLEPDIYGINLATRHGFPVHDRHFIIGPDESWEDMYAESFVVEAAQHFKEIGLI